MIKRSVARTPHHVSAWSPHSDRSRCYWLKHGSTSLKAGERRLPLSGNAAQSLPFRVSRHYTHPVISLWTRRNRIQAAGGSAAVNCRGDYPWGSQRQVLDEKSGRENVSVVEMSQLHRASRPAHESTAGRFTSDSLREIPAGDAQRSHRFWQSSRDGHHVRITPCGKSVVVGYRSSRSTSFVYVKSQEVDGDSVAWSAARGGAAFAKPVQDIDAFAALSWILSRSLAAARMTDEIFIQHVAIALCEVAEQRQLSVGASRQSDRSGLTLWQERRAKQLIESSLQKPASVADMATACGLSVAHFRRAFKLTTGVPPHRWLQDRRVARAKDLLKDGMLPLIEIADRCGFGDQSHFTSVFTKHVGRSPGSWRRASCALGNRETQADLTPRF